VRRPNLDVAVLIKSIGRRGLRRAFPAGVVEKIAAMFARISQESLRFLSASFLETKSRRVRTSFVCTTRS